MRDLLVASILFASLPFVLKRPFLGILMLAGLGYLNPHRLCYGFIYSFPVVQLMVVFTLVGMLMSKEAKRMIWSREIALLAIFVAWMGITTTQAFYGALAFDQYIKVIKIQILTVMTLLMLTTPQRVHFFIWVVVMSLSFYGVKGGIFTIVNGGAYRVQGPTGTFIDGNNELALALVMTIPLIRYLQLTETRKKVKTFLVVVMVLTIIAAFGSQSRGALVALIVTGAIFWMKSRNKIPTAIYIGVAAGIALSIMPPEWFARMSTIQTHEQDLSAIGRTNAWWTAFNIANSRIVGGGFETWGWAVFQMYAPDPDNVRDVHSVYFEILGEHGWIGLAMFLTLLGMTWRTGSAVIRFGKQNPDALWARDLASMIQVSMVGYLSAGAFLGLAYFDYIYHLIAVMVVLHALVVVPGRVLAPKGSQELPAPGSWSFTMAFRRL